MSLLSAAKDKGVELSGVNLEKDEVRLFSLLGITGGREKAQLRALVGSTRVTTEEKLTDTQQGYLDQAKKLNYPLSGVKLEEEEEEDELFNTFGLSEDDVASKSQLRYLVKREQLRANENKLMDEQRKANENIVALNHLNRTPAFLVGGTVIDAKQSKGARGNVFKFLENHYGHYSLTDGIQVDYTGNNLNFKAYFRSYEAACGFQNAMNQWEIHKELAHLGGVTLDPPTPAAVPWQSDFTRFYLQDYKPNDHESPCQTLDQLHSYHLSVPVTEPVEPATNLLRYQCIDQPMPHIKHYKCHLKDKAKFKQLQRNENNMVAASWLFHQQLDGLNVEEGIPLVALSWKAASNDRLVSHSGRYQVTLLVEFFYQELAAAFASTGLARKIDETSWEISVYVEDKHMFKECVDWKSTNTKKQWNEHRDFLNAE